MFNLLKSKIASRFMLLFLTLALTGTSLYGAATITATYIPTSIASGGGTGTTGYPFAVYVTISGWTANASGQAYIKLYSGSSNEFMWSATGAWSNTTTFSTANQPVFNINASGNATGWIYAKHNNSIASPYNLRAAKVGATSTNLTQTGIAFTALTLTSIGNGGWVIRNSSPAVNKAILAYSGSTVVGSYRTEDNGITEGYSYGSGGFKIAVPTGIIDSLVSYNDDGTRDQSFVGPWTVTAGNETDVATGGSSSAVGTAAIFPTFTGVTNQSVLVTVYGQSGDTITNVNVTVPTLWTWSQSTSDISVVGGGSPTSAVSGDTVQIGGLSVGGGDSVQIILHNVTPFDSTNYYTFSVLTGVSPSSLVSLSTNPRILVHGTPIPIGQAQANDANGVNLLLGKYVTVEGVVTVTNQFNGAGYIQDNSDGIAIYDSSLTNHVNIGDRIIIFGTMTQFNGLAELDPATLIQTVSAGNTVTPLVVTCSQIENDGVGGNENYEGLLVQINSVSLSPPIATWAVSGSGTNYNMTDGTGTIQIRVVPSVNYANQSAPQGPFSVICVVGQFKSASPYIGGYQVQPRFLSDILTSGPVITNAPAESNITSSSFTVNWSTLNNGTTRVRYGTTTSYELGLVAPDNTLGTSHTVNLTGLQAATIYHVQAFSVDSLADTSTAGDLVVSTSSPPQTTGQMNVYFNFSVNTSVSLGENAQGNVDLVSKILTRINNTRHSIDAALYSLSASGQGDALANAMVAAKNRGVRVRVICETTNGTGSGFNILRNNGVTVIDQNTDPTWNRQGIMHNKFFVFDYVGGTPDSVWVWGGSWNPTGEGTTQDRQNSIEIQDVALAGAYTSEFNQMWGSNTSTPNSAFSKFGSDKSDITPHHFVINGIPVSSYFSPSDKTTSHIGVTMSHAQYSLSGCMLTFTRSDLADTLVVKKNAGKKVREVVDNNTDSGTQYPFLLSSGIDVHLKGFSNGLLHHKYMVVDGDHSGGTPYLLTGSHNWSSAAENSNDENEEIIQSSRIANLYLQEFAARYYEAGGTDSIHVVNDGVTAPLFSSNKSSINFDTVHVNGSKQDSITVSNTGTATLTISSVTSSNATYTVTPPSASISAGGSQKFYVTFAPTAAGIVNAKITLTHNAMSNPDSVLLTGFGGLPSFSANSHSFNFDTVSVGQSKQDSLIVTNAGSENLIISSVVSSDTQFTVTPSLATISPAGSRAFIIAFTPKGTGGQSASIVLTHNAVGGSDTVSVHGVGSNNAILFSAAAGWNMISLPLVVLDGRQTTLFPHATSKLFAYSGGYVSIDSLVPSKGYWLKFPSTEIDTFTGAPMSADTFSINAKWNIIGAITYPVPVNSTTEIPPGNIVSNYYGYDSAYYVADTLYPGKAYWVKAKAVGSLIVTHNSSSNSRIKSVPKVSTTGTDQLIVTDASGRTQTLSFAEQPGDNVSLARYELPPVPPVGAFDVRFTSGRLIEFYDKNLSSATEFPILLQGMKFPVTVRWDINGGKSVVYALKIYNGTMSTTKLINQGSVILSDDSLTSVSLDIRPVVTIPVTYSLEQNYPNPFNPSTEIRYNLPERSRVLITIFNALGVTIATPVSDVQDAGTYRFTWKPNTASGVYFYRIQATSSEHPSVTFQRVLKAVVLK